MIRGKIKSILVPLDGSKNSFRGLEKAILLARQCQATITGLYVKPVPTSFALHSIGTIELAMEKDVKKILESAKKIAAQNGVLLYPKKIPGEPGYDIVRYSKDKKFDLIVIGARGMSGLKEVFLGSVSNYVLHKSKIPVMIVK